MRKTFLVKCKKCGRKSFNTWDFFCAECSKYGYAHIKELYKTDDIKALIKIYQETEDGFYRSEIVLRLAELGFKNLIIARELEGD
jgi:ribosomal protein L37E